MSKPWRFRPGEALDEAFRRTALEEIATARHVLETAEDRDKAIHEARRSIKKLRALLRLARPGLDEGFGRENRRLRDAGRLLAPARDAAVLLENYDRFTAERAADLDAAPVGALRARLVPRRASNGEDSERIEANIAKTLDLLARTERTLSRLDWPKTSAELHRGLRKSQAKLKASFRAARISANSEDLHEWRKRLKDTTSQVELLRDALPEDVKRARKASREIALVLGEEHDLCLLAARLKGLRAPATAHAARAALLERMARRRRKLRDKAFRLYEAQFSRGAESLAGALSASWEGQARAV